jgi:hypothetical protein
MKKYLVLLLCLWILFSIGAVVSADETVIDLVAGQHEVIGNVTVEQVGDELIVTYNVTSAGWCLTTTHLYVGSTPAQRHSPGRFPYKHENLDCVTVDTFTISDLTSDTVYVAAHADTFFSVNNNIDLNGTVQYTLDPSIDSYFDNVLTGTIAGDYLAWCVDVDRGIGVNVKYDGTAYSTLGSFPAELVDHPENMDLVNYIINQDYLGQGMSADDIQMAIWTLIDDRAPNPGTANTANVATIVADALANGEDFVPTCGDVVAIIIEPTIEAQTTIIEYPVPCPEGADRKETAWALAADGIAFRQGWGSYFTVQLNSADTAIAPADAATTSNSLTAINGNIDIALVETATTAINQAQAAANANNDGDDEDDGKVQVGHAAGNSGNWVQLEISRNGLNGFFNDDGSPRNGLDYIGRCNS